MFSTDGLSLQLDATVDCGDADKDSCPNVLFQKIRLGSSKSIDVTAQVRLQEGQAISFVLRDVADAARERITNSLIDHVQKGTTEYWFNWISKSRYKGRWRQAVNGSLMILKLLAFEPTGIIVAAPNFRCRKILEARGIGSTVSAG